MSNLIKRGRTWYGRWREGEREIWKALGDNRVTAQQKMAEILHNKRVIQNGSGPKEIGWKDFEEKYLSYSKTNKAPTSLCRDKIIFKNFDEAIPIGRLNEVTPEVLERFKQIRKEAGIQSSTINREVNILRSALKRAKEWGYRACDVSTVGKLPEPKKRPQFFSKEEIELMLEKADPFWKAIIHLGLYAGLRLGEMLALEWRDIDWERRILRVTPKPHWHPKDYDARDIPLHPTLEEYLKNWLAVSGKRAKVIPWSAPSCQMSSRFNFFLRKRCAIMQGSMHSLRHSFASYLAMADVSPYKIARLMGHSDVRTTEIYSHLFPSSLQEAIDRLTLLSANTPSRA
ncbi:MAG: site-specific integrase [Elusimicrobia bacterium]|nr:site-specific integrase [Elusimicrobiota bacterium]